MGEAVHICRCEKHVLAQPQHEQAKTSRLQQKQPTAGGQQALLQLTTGEQEHGSPIVGFRPPEASNSNSSLQASKQPATSSTGTRFQPSKLELAERIGFADHACVVLKAGQSFIRDVGRAHEEHVIFSH